MDIESLQYINEGFETDSVEDASNLFFNTTVSTMKKVLVKSNNMPFITFFLMYIKKENYYTVSFLAQPVANNYEKDRMNIILKDFITEVNKNLEEDLEILGSITVATANISKEINVKNKTKEEIAEIIKNHKLTNFEESLFLNYQDNKKSTVTAYELIRSDDGLVISNTPFIDKQEVDSKTIGLENFFK